MKMPEEEYKDYISLATEYGKEIAYNNIGCYDDFITATEEEKMAFANAFTAALVEIKTQTD